MNQMRASLLKARAFYSATLLYAVIALLFYVFNPQGLSFGYGSGYGRYADLGDSFSEYLVRNTVKRNILKREESDLLAIRTKGYATEDYSYYPDGYVKYTSNLALQTVPATLLARALRIDTERGVDLLLGALRLVNGLALAFLVASMLQYFARQEMGGARLLIPLLVGCSAGFIYFSQNLYFASALIVMPAYFVARDLVNRGRYRWWLVVLTGLLYFLRGYEFATVFALLTAFSAALFTDGAWRSRAWAAATAFGLICVAFLIAVVTHVLVLSADSGWSLSLADAAKEAFANVSHRVASLHGVPAPFSPAFYATLKERWSLPAFSLVNGWPALSELAVIVLLLLGGAVRWRWAPARERAIYLYGFAGYMSWYIFAYQHIMWHNMYDWYIFALTLGLAFSFLTLLYVSMLLRFLTGFHLRVGGNG